MSRRGAAPALVLLVGGGCGDSSDAADSDEAPVLAEGEAPRLSTFVWRDGDWKMVAHANFNTAAR